MTHPNSPILHPAGRPINIAHRGARSLAPENTLAAALKALACGADMWELDVRLTADLVPVVFHDQTMERTTDILTRPDFNGRPPVVHAFTLDELRQLDAGSWFIEADPFGQIALGAVPPADLEAFRETAIPSLAEALALTREHGWRVNVEIKDHVGLPGHDQVVERTLYEVARAGMEDRVIISSFNHDYIRRVKRDRPGLTGAALVEEETADPVALMESVGADAYHPGAWVVTPEQIRALREQGFAVNVWAVNEESAMRDFLAWGVTGLCTDFPQVLTPILREFFSIRLSVVSQKKIEKYSVG